MLSKQIRSMLPMLFLLVTGVIVAPVISLWADFFIGDQNPENLNDNLTDTYSRPDVIFAGEGVDYVNGQNGDDIIAGGRGVDHLWGGSGSDIFVFDATLLPDWSDHYDYIYDFETGVGGDKIDVSPLLEEVGYTGSDPVGEGYIRIADVSKNGVKRLKIQFDKDGFGGEGPEGIAILDSLNPDDVFDPAENLLLNEEKKTILFLVILGQSNARGLRVVNGDSDSGVIQLETGLHNVTDFDMVVSLFKKIEGGKAQYIDLAEGGSTVDGRYESRPQKIWLKNNMPGEALLNAINHIDKQLSMLKVLGDVKVAIIWGQGETEAERMGLEGLGTPEEYKNATLSIFRHLKEAFSADIYDVYLMQTGRIQRDGAKNDGLSDTDIDIVIRNNFFTF